MIKSTITFFILLYSVAVCAFAEDTIALQQAREYRDEGLRKQSFKKYSEAKSFFEKAISLDSMFKEAYNDLGVVCEQLGDTLTAEQMYLKAVDIDPDYLPPYANLGFLYERKKDFPHAAYYWYLRYQKGKEGDLWTEKARKYFMRLSRYPGVSEKVKAFDSRVRAKDLSDRQAYESRQYRQELNEKAQNYFDRGMEAFKRERYKSASAEFEAGYLLQPSDQKLRADLKEYYRKAKKQTVKEEVALHITNGLNYLKTDDYLSLTQELKRAIALVLEIPKE